MTFNLYCYGKIIDYKNQFSINKISSIFFNNEIVHKHEYKKKLCVYFKDTVLDESHLKYNNINNYTINQVFMKNVIFV